MSIGNVETLLNYPNFVKRLEQTEAFNQVFNLPIGYMERPHWLQQVPLNTQYQRGMTYRYIMTENDKLDAIFVHDSESRNNMAKFIGIPHPVTDFYQNVAGNPNFCFTSPSSKASNKLNDQMLIGQSAVNPHSAEDSEANLRRQFYHHRHHIQAQTQNAKNQARFSATGSSSNYMIVRDTKFSLTSAPCSPTAGSIGGSINGFPTNMINNNYYASSSSGCHSKTSTSSYSSCSSLSSNSISPRKRRADDSCNLRRTGCRSSNSSGVGSYCSCDVCTTADVTARVDDVTIKDSEVIQNGNGKRSKNEYEDEDVVFVSATPPSTGYQAFQQNSSFANAKNKKKRNYKKSGNAKAKACFTGNSRCSSPFIIPPPIPAATPKSQSVQQTNRYYLRSSVKDNNKIPCSSLATSTGISPTKSINSNLSSENILKNTQKTVPQQQNRNSVTPSMEKSIQALAINNCDVVTNKVSTYQTRSKLNKLSKKDKKYPLTEQSLHTSPTSFNLAALARDDAKSIPKDVSTPQPSTLQNSYSPKANDILQNSSSSSRKDPRSSSFFKKMYEIHGVIGVGGGGTVYAGTRKSDGIQVAVKQVPKAKVKRWGKLNDRVVPIEFDLLHRVTRTGHKGIISMLDWYERRNSYILVMERPQPVIDLFDYLNQNGALSESQARRIFLQIADSVLHCHANGVVHRDIKDENVLLNLHTSEAKLIDFGCGTLSKDTPYTEFAGTPEFYPPEWFINKRYNGQRVDAWSLGILLFTMLEAEVPFQKEKDIVACQLRHKHPEKLSDSCKNLLAWMLQKDVSKRPTLVETLQHPWFKEGLRSSKSSSGVMGTSELFSVSTGNSSSCNESVSYGHMIATSDSPMSPQHEINDINAVFQSAQTECVAG